MTATATLTAPATFNLDPFRELTDRITTASQSARSTVARLEAERDGLVLDALIGSADDAATLDRLDAQLAAARKRLTLVPIARQQVEAMAQRTARDYLAGLQQQMDGELSRLHLEYAELEQRLSKTPTLVADPAVVDRAALLWTQYRFLTIALRAETKAQRYDERLPWFSAALERFRAQSVGLRMQAGDNALKGEWVRPCQAEIEAYRKLRLRLERGPLLD